MSFGIIKLVNYFKYDGKKKKSFLNSNFIKFSFILIIIVFSSTGLLVHGARKINMERKVRDTEAHIIGWAAKNVPGNTNILIDSRYELRRGLETMAMRNAKYIDYFLNNVNTNNITLLINQTKEQNYQYLIIHTHYLYIGIYNKSATQIVRDLLIPQFFNKTIYTYRDIIVCTSPYYNNV
ncbi:MAG: hypothetical protein ACOC1K_05805 [Nanoarchaeota archaeon]